MDPELWTQPLQHHSNNKYHLYSVLILWTFLYNFLAHFCFKVKSSHSIKVGLLNPGKCDDQWHAVWQCHRVNFLCFPHHHFKRFFVRNLMILSECIHWESFLCNNFIYYTKSAESACSPCQKWPSRVYRAYLLNHNSNEYIWQTHFTWNFILNQSFR